MEHKSESSDRYRTQRASGEISQDKQKEGGLHERVASRNVNIEMSTSSLLIGAYMRRV